MAGVGKERAPRRRRQATNTPAPTTPDPIEIAMQAEASGKAPSGVAWRLLFNQNRLVLWEIADRRAAFGLKLLTGFAGLTVAAGLALMVWQAVHADGVRLEPFRVSATLAAEGVSGEVLASQVLDELSSLRAETVETGRSREYENAWGQEISVAIPTTGINLGDLQTALRRWLGHETVITGEAFRTATGAIALRARVRGGVAIRADGADGAEGDLEALARSLARDIYRDTQPVRLARWLADHGDLPGALALAQRTALSASDPRTRAEAYAEWANATDIAGAPRDAVALSLKARRLAPDWWLPAYQLSNHEFNLGHYEAALRYMREAVRLKARDPSLRKEDRDASFYRIRAAGMAQDWVERSKHLSAAMEDPASIAALGSTLDRTAVSGMANIHDILGAEARLRRPQYVRPWRGELELQSLRNARMTILEMAESWAALAAEPVPAGVQFSRGGGSTLIGFAKVASSDVAGGMAILNGVPADCDPCMLYRARALALTGDVATADRLAATVEARTPSIPIASLVRGRIRLDAGDPAAALVSLREAQRRQPNWADPYRYEGDALARLGRWAEAVAAYEKAFKLAPKWGGLHLKWGLALQKLGQAKAAADHFNLAAQLHLTPPERAELAGRPR